jgi:hypothetical protein
MDSGITHIYKYKATGLDIPKEQRSMDKSKDPLVEYQMFSLNFG